MHGVSFCLAYATPSSEILPVAGLWSAKLFQPQHGPVKFFVFSRTGEIVECFFRYPDDMVFDKAGAFSCPVLRVFDAAFPFEDGPAFEIVGGQLAKDRLKI